MKAKRLVLALVLVLSIARVAMAETPDAVVTDEASMRALAASGHRGIIRGTVSSVSFKEDFVFLHFEGVKNDRVTAGTSDPQIQSSYGPNLAGLVGKTVDITSKVRVNDDGTIFFGPGDPSSLNLLDAAPDTPKGTDGEVAQLAPKQRQVMQTLIKAGEDGNELAQEELGYIYFAGQEGVRRDYEKAKYWLLKATEDRHPHPSIMANILLGQMYDKGLGVRRDVDWAYGYYDYVRTHGTPELVKVIRPQWERLDKEKADENSAEQGMVWQTDEYGNPHRVRLRPGGGTSADDQKGEEAVAILVTAAAVAALLSRGGKTDSSTPSGPTPVMMCYQRTFVLDSTLGHYEMGMAPCDIQ